MSAVASQYPAPPASDATIAPGLVARYREPHRVAHGADYLARLMFLFEEYRTGFHAREAARLALQYGSAILNPLSETNEADSAELLEAEAPAGLDRETLAQAKAMIVAGEEHLVPDVGTDAFRADCALYLDLRLAVLATVPAIYEMHEAGLRQEHAYMPPAAYAHGRSSVIETLLARPRLFLTPAFEEDGERQARANLAATLQRLAHDLDAPACRYHQTLAPVAHLDSLHRHRRRLAWSLLAPLVREAKLTRSAQDRLAEGLVLTGYGLSALRNVLRDEMIPAVLADPALLPGNAGDCDRLEAWLVRRDETPKDRSTGPLERWQAMLPGWLTGADRASAEIDHHPALAAWPGLAEGLRLAWQRHRLPNPDAEGAISN